MQQLGTFSALEMPEKDLVSTANQSKIILTSPCIDEALNQGYEAPTGDTDDILSIKSLFGQNHDPRMCSNCRPTVATHQKIFFTFEESEHCTTLCDKISPAMRHAEEHELNLYSLVPVLQDIFLGDSLPPLDSLSLSQMKILVAILRRKLGRKNLNFDEKREELEEEIKNFQNKLGTFSVKRTEENNKFVFKQILKIIQARKKKKLPPLKCDEGGVGICEFNQPKDSVEDPSTSGRTDKKVRNLSSLSLGALNEILKDEELCLEFKKVLMEPCVEKSEFLRNYFSSLTSKITKLLQKWEKQLKKYDDSSEVFRKMLMYFLTNNQCKLPWTYFEILKAIKCFVESLRWPSRSSFES